ncbi:MAG: AraC family transcriptional regulator ligand-binding domain-containing protein [Chloroflexota bacterium]
MDNRKYPLDIAWELLCKDLNISSQDVLRHGNLPLDLFSRKSPMITGTEFFRLWEGLTAVLRDNPTFPLDFATSITPEMFNPPLFASFCSPNLTIAAQRVAHYKPIVGPLRLLVETTNRGMTISIETLPGYGKLSASMTAAELLLWVHILRLATREDLVPLSFHTTMEMPEKGAYEAYLGVPLSRADSNGVTFSAEDATRPFLTANDAMWSIFEPELNRRMQDLSQRATYTEKVRACLMEILASGQYNVNDVALRLAVSRRTLQRHLRNEGTSFQQELDRLREELARHYLTKSEYSSGQIAFLLGYEEPNSFYRAFRSWTGQTPEVVRASV